jgi:hypothetical protein
MSPSRPRATKKVRYTKTPLVTQMYVKLRNSRWTSLDKSTKEVEDQIIEDRFGDVPE